MKKIVVLIPALNPNRDFIKYSKQLTKLDNIDLIVINDGSDEQYDVVFNEISKIKNAIVLKHAVNCGKGRGLKTGLNYFINKYSKDDVVGIVTADSDGQHRIEDVIKVSKVLAKQKNNALVLGTRNFNKKTVPFKSKMGNKITTTIFKLLYGKKICDTQTGLRGLTYDFAKACLNIYGERYEYEINMLIKAVKEKVIIHEPYIETIYINNNSESHFNPLVDSFKIYRVLFREFLSFGASGLTSAGLDLLLFTLLYNAFKNRLQKSLIILIPTIISRIISSLYNYTVNKKIVFKNKNRNSSTILKYYFLAICQMSVSWLLVDIIFKQIKLVHPTYIKVIVDIILFLLSYQIQQKWVFSNKKIIDNK